MVRNVYNMVAVATDLETLEHFRVNTDLDGCDHGMAMIARGQRAQQQPWHMAVGATYQGMVMLCQACGSNCLSEEGGDAFVVLPDRRANYSLDGRMDAGGEEFQQHVLAEESETGKYKPGPMAVSTEARISCMACLKTDTAELLATFYRTGELIPAKARRLGEG